MAYYFQRERNLEDVISNGSIVKFNTPITVSESDIEPSTDDFNYNDDGTIDILRPGVYIIFWFVAQMTGLATDGEAFGLKKFNYDEQILEWVPLAGAVSHVKISSTFGFGTVDVTDAEIETFEKVTVALFNVSNNDAKLTSHAHAKSGILITGQDDLTLKKRIEELESRVTYLEKSVTELYEQVYCIEEFIRLSTVTEMWSPTIELSGSGAAVIYSGVTYNFWGTGALDHQQTLNNMTTYYLITSDQYTNLTYYQGEATIGTLWIETPFGENYALPIRFDNTGIYFTPNIQLTNLPIGTTFKFTQSLILVSPDGL